MAQALLPEFLARREAAALPRLGAWACIALLAVLSLLPGAEIEVVRTGADTRLEHVMAYAGTMLLAGLAWGGSTPLPRIGLRLVLYATALELAQLFVPGRNASFADLGSGVIGIIAAGLVLRACVARLVSARRAGAT